MELESADTGTRLTLTHSLPAQLRGRLGFLAGWHDFLDRFEVALAGGQAATSEDRWRQLTHSYEILRIPELAE